MMLPFRPLHLVVLAVMASSLAAEPRLFKDFDPREQERSSDVMFLHATSDGARFVFSAASWYPGRRDLWISNGIPHETRELPFPETVSISFLGLVDGGGLYSRRLSNGTEAEVLFLGESGAPATVARAKGQGQILSLAVYRGSVYFSAGATDGVDVELWRSDGTVEGTALLDLNPGGAGSQPNSAVVLGDWIYFFATTPAGSGLHRTDGTVAGTSFIAPGSPPFAMQVVNDRLVFFQRTQDRTRAEIWVSDGTPSGTSMAMEVPDPQSTMSVVGALRSRLFFSYASEVWVTDGTPGGTHRADISAGTGAELIGSGFTLGERMFFWSYAASADILFVTDGTAAGTKRLRQFQHGQPVYGFELRGSYYFGAAEEATGRELWISDGTEAGTNRVLDLNPGAADGLPQGIFFGKIAGGVLLKANVPGLGMELWFTDGTSPGTRLVRDIRSGAATGLPQSFKTTNNGMYLMAYGASLWKIAPNGDLTNVAIDGPALDPSRLVTSGGLLYFYRGSAYEQTISGVIQVQELWRTDGTAQGTFRLHDKVPLTGGVPLAVPSGVMFMGYDPVYGLEPWISDGTVAGTRLWLDLRPGNQSSGAVPMFYTSQGTTILQIREGYGMWISDGTLSGSVKIDGVSPQKIVEMDGSYYVSNGGRLWRTDGTIAGTMKLEEGSSTIFRLWAGSSRLFFMTADGIFASDGTAGASLRVRSQFNAGGCSHFDTAGEVMNDVLYWVDGASDATSGLWRSDGTAGGTRLLHKFGSVGSVSCSKQIMVVAGDRLWFRGHDEFTGYELWSSDGTVEGTKLVYDLDPGSGSSSPDEFTIFGDYLYFRATTPATGAELFRHLLVPQPRRRGVRH